MSHKSCNVKTASFQCTKNIPSINDFPHQRKEPAKLKQGNNNLFNERVTLQKIMRPTENARTSHDARLLRNSAFMHFYTSTRFR